MRRIITCIVFVASMLVFGDALSDSGKPAKPLAKTPLQDIDDGTGIVTRLGGFGVLIYLLIGARKNGLFGSDDSKVKDHVDSVVKECLSKIEAATKDHEFSVKSEIADMRSRLSAEHSAAKDRDSVMLVMVQRLVDAHSEKKTIEKVLGEVARQFGNQRASNDSAKGD